MNKAMKTFLFFTFIKILEKFRAEILNFYDKRKM